MAIINEDFKGGLIQCIKTAGEMLIENAEDIAGETEYMSGLSISINFDQEMKCIPEITIHRTHVPDNEKLNAIFEAFYRKNDPE